jgi:hypothetical protein
MIGSEAHRIPRKEGDPFICWYCDKELIGWDWRTQGLFCSDKCKEDWDNRPSDPDKEPHSSDDDYI